MSQNGIALPLIMPRRAASWLLGLSCCPLLAGCSSSQTEKAGGSVHSGSEHSGSEHSGSGYSGKAEPSEEVGSASPATAGEQPGASVQTVPAQQGSTGQQSNAAAAAAAQTDSKPDNHSADLLAETTATDSPGVSASTSQAAQWARQLKVLEALIAEKKLAEAYAALGEFDKIYSVAELPDAAEIDFLDDFLEADRPSSTLPPTVSGPSEVEMAQLERLRQRVLAGQEKIPSLDELRETLGHVTSAERADSSRKTQAGSIRFIRLQYEGGDWNQDFGIGADANLLIEYGLRTRQRVAKQTESRRIPQLKNFRVGKSPPLVYLTGDGSITLSNEEVSILREYLLDKHGMLFGNNAGSLNFHQEFMQLMQQVLPSVRPVPVVIDDVIHQRPYSIPFLPLVKEYGGKEALGWKVNNRWVCYYHPGDLGAIWADGHSGLDKNSTELSYQLGVNIIFYAHAEYSKWLQQRRDEAARELPKPVAP